MANQQGSSASPPPLVLLIEELKREQQRLTDAAKEIGWYIDSAGQLLQTFNPPSLESRDIMLNLTGPADSSYNLRAQLGRQVRLIRDFFKLHALQSSEAQCLPWLYRDHVRVGLSYMQAIGVGSFSPIPPTQEFANHQLGFGLSPVDTSASSCTPPPASDNVKLEREDELNGGLDHEQDSDDDDIQIVEERCGPSSSRLQPPRPHVWPTNLKVEDVATSADVGPACDVMQPPVTQAQQVPQPSHWPQPPIGQQAPFKYQHPFPNESPASTRPPSTANPHLSPPTHRLSHENDQNMPVRQRLEARLSAPANAPDVSRIGISTDASGGGFASRPRAVIPGAVGLPPPAATDVPISPVDGEVRRFMQGDPAKKEGPPSEPDVANPPYQSPVQRNTPSAATLGKRHSTVPGLTSTDEDEGPGTSSQASTPSRARCSSGSSTAKRSKRPDSRAFMQIKDMTKESQQARKRVKDFHSRTEASEKQDVHIVTKAPDVAGGDMIVEAVHLEFEDGEVERRQTRVPTLSVDKKLLKNLKVHQAEGVVFMYKRMIESRRRTIENQMPIGSILAHCMGLGKTRQVIILLNMIVMNSDWTGLVAKMNAEAEKVGLQPTYELPRLKRVLVLAPANVVITWSDEFTTWQEQMPVKKRLKHTYMIGVTKVEARLRNIEEWNEKGGVLIMSYDLFANIVMPADKDGRKDKDKQKTRLMKNYLCPEDGVKGVDIAVFDEAHLLQHGSSKCHQAVKMIKTQRRVLLTGTPFQNNLFEYFTMVDLAVPRLLGTIQEFRSRYSNAIEEGQVKDATPQQVKNMQMRTRYLNLETDPIIHRKDHTLLSKYLPKRHEFVLQIELTDIQRRMYDDYCKRATQELQMKKLNVNDRENEKRGRWWRDEKEFNKIAQHPIVLQRMHARSAQQRGKRKPLAEPADPNVEEDMVLVEVDVDEQYQYENEEMVEPSNTADEVECSTANVVEPWWQPYMSQVTDGIEMSAKMGVVFDLIERCNQAGDKVVVFSWYLDTLDLIMKYLESGISVHGSKVKSKRKNTHFVRLDGSTSLQERMTMIKNFNNPQNKQLSIFLASAGAGGLGVSLTGANRVIMFDMHWNPTKDMQAIFRVYRFGQTKEVFVYRLAGYGTYEKTLYDRQIMKQSIFLRVVDKRFITRHFNKQDLEDLYTSPATLVQGLEWDEPFGMFDDPVLVALNANNPSIKQVIAHDTLLKHQEDEEQLTDEEYSQVELEMEQEKTGLGRRRSSKKEVEKAARIAGMQ